MIRGAGSFWSTGLSGPFSFSTGRHHRLPAFRAVANVGIILAGRIAVIPVSRWGRRLHRPWRGHIDWCGVGLTVCCSPDGKAGNGEYRGRPDPVGAMSVSVVMVLIMAVLISIRPMVSVVSPISLGDSAGGQAQADDQAEGSCLLHYLARNRCFDKPNNAASRQSIAATVYASVSNCYWRTWGGRAVRQCWPVETSRALAGFRKTEAEMKKGLVCTRPSIKIAGAQEGTRTPTELPAST